MTSGRRIGSLAATARPPDSSFCPPVREATQTRPWLQQLGGKSKAECKATKSKATKSKAKSDTSPATPEFAAARSVSYTHLTLPTIYSV